MSALILSPLSFISVSKWSWFSPIRACQEPPAKLTESLLNFSIPAFIKKRYLKTAKISPCCFSQDDTTAVRAATALNRDVISKKISKKKPAQALVLQSLQRAEVRECGIDAAAPSSRHGSVLASPHCSLCLGSRERRDLIRGNGVKGAEGGTGTRTWLLDLHCPGLPEPSHRISEGIGDQKWQRAAPHEALRDTQEPTQTELSSGKLFHSINSFPCSQSPTQPAAF